MFVVIAKTQGCQTEGPFRPVSNPCKAVLSPIGDTKQLRIYAPYTVCVIQNLNNKPHKFFHRNYTKLNIGAACFVCASVYRGNNIS